MAKRKGSSKGKPKRTRSAGRTNTHKSNGSLPESQAVAPTTEPERVPIAEAMRQAEEALGTMSIDRDHAAEQLGDIASAQIDVVRRQAAVNARAEELKTAKKSLESARALVDEKIRMYAFPTSAGPLIDLATREADQEAMLDAAEQDAPLGDLEPSEVDGVPADA